MKQIFPPRSVELRLFGCFGISHSRFKGFFIVIRTWHIPISGFTQNIDRQNGFDRLWKQLRPLASEHVSLLPPQRWRADFSAIAEFIHRMKPENTVPEIRVYAYSWGCGHGFLKLATELLKRGLSIRYAVLCDPVYHSWWRPWRAMLTGRWSPPIRIPKNVGEVFWFRQFQNRPQGTDLVSADPATVIHEPVVLNAHHEWMDDQREFHDTCLEVAAK